MNTNIFDEKRFIPIQIVSDTGEGYWINSKELAIGNEFIDIIIQKARFHSRKVQIGN